MSDRFVAVVTLVALALLVGCGRKATEADCQVIVDQMVVVKMKKKNNTDPAAVTKLQAELREEAKGERQHVVRRNGLGRRTRPLKRPSSRSR